MSILQFNKITIFTMKVSIFFGIFLNEYAFSNGTNSWEYSRYQRNEVDAVSASAAIFNDENNQAFGFLCNNRGLFVAMFLRGDDRPLLMHTENSRVSVRLNFDGQLIRDGDWIPARNSSILQNRFSDISDMMDLAQEYDTVSVSFMYADGENRTIEFSLRGAAEAIEPMTDACSSTP